MPSFEFGPTVNDDGSEADEFVRTLGRVDSPSAGIVTLDLGLSIGMEGESMKESAVRWTAGFRFQPDAARMLAGFLLTAAEKAEETP